MRKNQKQQSVASFEWYTIGKIVKVKTGTDVFKVRDAVSDGDDGAIGELGSNGLLHHGLGFQVHRGRGLVENQNPLKDESSLKKDAEADCFRERK